VAIKPRAVDHATRQKDLLLLLGVDEPVAHTYTPPTGERKNSPVTDESDASGLEFDVTAGSNTINIELTSK